MTFGGQIVYLWPEQSEGGNDASKVTNKLSVPDKSHVIIILINIQCQIVQIYVIRQRLFNVKSCCGLQIPFTARNLPFGPRIGAL